MKLRNRKAEIGIILFCIFSLSSIAKAEDAPQFIFTEINANTTHAKEWIEITNVGTQPVSLEGWRLFTHDTNHLLKSDDGWTVQPGAAAVIAYDAVALKAALAFPSGTTLIDSTWSSLANYAGAIQLKNPAGTVVATYGGGQVSSGITLAYDGAAWKTTTQPTPATYPNSFPVAPIVPVADISSLKALRLNELLPAPKSSDANEMPEYVEIFNGGAYVDLSNVFVANSKGQNYNRSGTSLAGGETLHWTYDASKVNLRNDGDTITLYYRDPGTGEETVLDRVTYPEAEYGMGYAFNADTNEWRWTETPTPGTKNVFLFSNHAPVISVDISSREATMGESLSFDALGSSDVDGDPLVGHWDLGDGEARDGMAIAYAYKTAGSYAVKFSLSDGKTTVEKIWTVKIKDTGNAVSGSVSSPSSKATAKKTVAAKPKAKKYWWPSFSKLFPMTALPSKKLNALLKEESKKKIAKTKKGDVDLVDYQATVLVPPGMISDYQFLARVARDEDAVGIRRIKFRFGSFVKLASGDRITISFDEEKQDVAVWALKRNADAQKISGGTPPAAVQYGIASLVADMPESRAAVNGVVVKKSGSAISIDDGSGELRLLGKATGLKDGNRVSATGYVIPEKDGALFVLDAAPQALLEEGEVVTPAALPAVAAEKEHSGLFDSIKSIFGN